jgi:hypothetical protein
MILIQALRRNVGTCWFNAKGRGMAALSHFASPHVNQRGGTTRSRVEAAVIAVERRGCVIQPGLIVNP